jgi:hypothetical protein
MTQDAELEQFKTQIDLREFAASMGYVLDRRDSWQGSAAMRHAETDDKIIIKRDTDRHYVYFSVRDAADNGSIIDFLQKRRRCSLGRVRQTLRPWIGKTDATFPTLTVTTKDRMAVETAFRRMSPAPTHPYLENERKIPAAVLALPRFAGRVMIDERGNAIFPHFDLEGLCGYEIKNKGFTQFAKGGEKGLWVSHTESQDTRLVICESAIDALSHAALFPAPQNRYASIGGQVNATQPDLLRVALKRLPEGCVVISGTDADPDGERLSELLCGAVKACERSDLIFLRETPPMGKDWNDQLRAAV